MKSEQDFEKSFNESMSSKKILSTTSLKSQNELMSTGMIQILDVQNNDIEQLAEEDVTQLKKIFSDLRDFKMDKENKIELVNPSRRIITQTLGLWKKRPVKHPNYKVTMVLQSPKVEKQKILEYTEPFASIKLIIDGEELENKKAIQKLQNGVYYEGIDGEYMMITKINGVAVDYYEGMTKDFIENGHGLLNHVVGGKTVWHYFGQFVDGKRGGKGREISGRGVSYEGDFKNDFKHGKGVEVVIKKKKHPQQGQDPFAEKNRYIGEFQLGYKEGIGTEITPHGQYNGQWHQGMKHGKGIIKYKKGDTYEGQWANNCQHGQGVYTEMVLINQQQKFNTYTGEFKEGYYHGKGQMEYFNGDKYDGEWAFGKKEGEGMYQWNDGDYYDGHWEKDSAEGTGASCFGGVFYDGEFHLGEKHGLGEETDEDGNTLKAIWDSGKIIKKLQINGEIIDPQQDQN